MKPAKKVVDLLEEAINCIDQAQQALLRVRAKRTEHQDLVIHAWREIGKHKDTLRMFVLDEIRKDTT